jgi:ribosomal protein L31E
LGETARDTAREVELTRKQMEERLSELSERAPREARKLLKRVLFAVFTAVAVVVTRKLVDRLWERFTGELPPTKVESE